MEMIKYFLVMFKSKLKFFLLFLILSISFVGKVAYSATGVTNIVFTTPEQTISINAPSEIISIQTRKSDSSSSPIGETSDLYLTSSSPTGEFSASSTNWSVIVGKTTFNSNWSNKNFYYKNSVSGEDTITATLITRISSSTFSVSQNIKVSDSDSNLDNNSNNDSTTTVTSTKNSDDASNIKVVTKTVYRYISTHSSEEDLSDFSEGSLFEVSAGRERIAYVGAPIEFVAKHKSIQNIANCSSSFDWSFGDGVSDKGEKIVHSYKYSGEYAVVLNGDCDGNESVSRTTVKVLNPKISIEITQDGDMKIKNTGDVEINLGGWRLNDLYLNFIFPKDTIISANKEIVFSREDTKISANIGDLITLNNPSGREVVSLENIGNVATSSRVVNPTSNEEALSTTSVKVQTVASDFKSKVVLNDEPKINKLNSTTTIKTEDTLDISEVATVAESVTSSSTNKGFWNNFIINGIKSFARMFYNF